MERFGHLFSPITVGSMTVRNRIFMAPMSTHLADTEGRVTEELLAYYTARARGGAGYITIPSVLIEKLSRYGTYRNVGLFEDWQVENLKKLTDAVHVQGACIGAQLLHPAVAAPSSYNEGRQPVAASPVEARAYDELPRPLTVAEIRDYVRRFAEAAGRARAAGFDAVEIHSCHRHGLLGSFLSPLHNKRIDAYGGSVENRARMTVEVIRAVREQVGAEYPIIVRMSACDEEPGGQSLTEGMHIARLFEEAGASMIHLSDGSLDIPWKTTAPSGTPQGFNMDYAAKIRGAVHIPLGVVGRINEPWVGELLLEQGACDAVYVGRALICDPEFPNKARRDPASIRPCIGCLRCLAAANADRTFCCTVNPEAGRETMADAPWPAREKKRILVVGGGPGGLTAAAYAAERGHDVTLVERAGRLGGQMYLAAFPPCKQEIAKATAYMIRRAESAGAEILLNTEATLETVKKGGYDLVIVAAGSRNLLPKFLSGAAHLVTARDALEGNAPVGRNVVVVGGGPVGCETADYLIHPHLDLSARGRRVTLIEMDTVLAREERTSARPLLIARLLEKGCRILTGAKVLSVEGDQIVYEQDGVRQTLTGVDTVVSAAGFAYETGLAQELAAAGIAVYAITETSDIRIATSGAYEYVRHHL